METFSLFSWHSFSFWWWFLKMLPELWCRKELQSIFKPVSVGIGPPCIPPCIGRDPCRVFLPPVVTSPAPGGSDLIGGALSGWNLFKVLATVIINTIFMFCLGWQIFSYKLELLTFSPKYTLYIFWPNCAFCKIAFCRRRNSLKNCHFVTLLCIIWYWVVFLDVLWYFIFLSDWQDI